VKERTDKGAGASSALSPSPLLSSPLPLTQKLERERDPPTQRLHKNEHHTIINDSNHTAMTTATIAIHHHHHSA
jgi:hypothetical protein